MFTTFSLKQISNLKFKTYVKNFEFPLIFWFFDDHLNKCKKYNLHHFQNIRVILTNCSYLRVLISE